jgi:methionyl-tRNA formyltransferase
VTVDIHGRAIKLLRVQDSTSPKQSLAGVLIDADSGVIACGHASQLQMLEVQPSGGKAMKWGEYRRGAGRTLSAGVVVSTPMPAGSTPE